MEYAAKLFTGSSTESNGTGRNDVKINAAKNFSINVDQFKLRIKFVKRFNRHFKMLDAFEISNWQ